VNSSAEVKAESDICCTSANAAAVVRSIASSEVLFAPDQNLASWVQEQVPEKRVIAYDGFCYVHHRIRADEIVEARKRHPGALVLAHPETRAEVRHLADHVLSTSGMLRFVRDHDATRYIIVTEEGLRSALVAEHPDREFFHPLAPRRCSNMKKTTLDDVLASLTLERYEITVNPDVQQKALAALERMIAIS
jgi:quinolinate synthase